VILHRLGFFPYLPLIMLVCIHPGVAVSAVPVPEGYRLIAAEQGIPPAIFYAIALTESGREIPAQDMRRPWPWTLNVEGHGYTYASRLKAWQALSDWLQRGVRSIDIGLMQVNWRYHEQKLGEPWHALDPYHNLRVAAAILRACYQSRRDWWSSVGCYHAPSNPERARQYRRRVRSQWQTLNTGA